MTMSKKFDIRVNKPIEVGSIHLASMLEANGEDWSALQLNAWTLEDLARASEFFEELRDRPWSEGDASDFYGLAGILIRHFLRSREARLDCTEEKEKEVTRRKGKHPSTLYLEEIVKREWERGLTDKEIADDLNYSSTYISNIRRDLGLERNHTKIHEKRAKEISELYEKGMSDSKISYELDINKYHVQEWRRKNGKPTHYPQKGGRK